MIVRLSHPWKWHHIRDILDSDTGDLTAMEARHLVRAGHAVDVETLLTPGPGGWVTVDLRAGPTRVRGRARALDALRKDARQ